MTFIPSPTKHDLEEEDVRSIVCLMGEVAAMRGEIHQARRHLMDGLCSMIRADHWFWFAADAGLGKAPAYSVMCQEGIEDEKFSQIHHSIGLALERSRQHLLHPMPPEQDSDLHLFFSEAGVPWTALGVGSLVMSLRQSEPEMASGACLYRNIGTEEFTPRETKIAHILLTEVHWLLRREFPQPQEISHLYPRQRAVFDLLCEGWDRKKIANHLGLSVQTVHGYVKEIFRHLEVHSQAELVSRMGKGNGGGR
jgi:DNA-binding CsgD family transcriptional regulator